MAPALNNFWTSFSTTLAFSEEARRGLCLIGLMVGSRGGKFYHLYRIKLYQPVPILKRTKIW